MESPVDLLLALAIILLLLPQNIMNDLRAGFSLDGYYMYDDGNSIGVFMKENSGHKFFFCTYTY